LINKAEIDDELSGATGANLAFCLELMVLNCQKFKPLEMLSVQICGLFSVFFFCFSIPIYDAEE